MCFRLPKLAVSAKLLFCLLMVVSCDRQPLVKRSVRLYNQCSCSMLAVNMTGAVLADNSEDGFENLEIQSEDYSGRLLIYGKAARRYLCFTPRGKLVGAVKPRKNRCYFTEEMVAGGYYRFRSSSNRNRYLGFNRSGRQLRGKHPANCLNWVKIDSGFSIVKHNEVLAGEPKVNLESIPDLDATSSGVLLTSSRRRYRHRKHHRLLRNNSRRD